MRLTARIDVERDVHTVWGFLADPMNSSTWDTSIAEVVPTAANEPPSVGWEALTVSPGGKRQRFRITAFEPTQALEFELLGDRMFIQYVLRQLAGS